MILGAVCNGIIYYIILHYITLYYYITIFGYYSFEVGIVRIAKSSQVLSLEVAEHIPRQFETSFLQNLDRLVEAGDR